MKITIDNHDGAGAVDYTGALAGSAPLVMTRKLNQPSECTCALDVNAAGLKVPAAYGRVVVASDAGVVMFTGYVAHLPAAQPAGVAMSGMVYQQQVTALSDEMLLDQQSVPVTGGNVSGTVANAMQVLTQRVDPVRIALAAGAAVNTVGRFVPDAAVAWSESAGTLAAMARSSYRVVNGQLTLQPIGAVTHALSEGAGTLDVSRFSLTQTKVLANDMTVCGASEPQPYVTEVFQGDGTTMTFELLRRPFVVTARKGALVNEAFSGPAINTVVWQPVDPGSRLSLTGAGLTVNGGNGLDGQTTLTAIDSVEMGGALVLTAGGVQANAGSDGYIACFYNGSVLLANLFAGFHVKQSAGGMVVAPVVHGVEAGASAALLAGHAYSLRLRFHAREMQRVLASYYAGSAAGQQVFGGGLVASAADLVFEVQDTTGGVNQPAVVLYDGAVSDAPASCVLAAVNSPAFTGSVGSVVLEETGPVWVSSLQTSGGAFTRRLGLATVGADCRVTGTGKLVFYATSVPQAGELITVRYRVAGGAVARLVNAASVAAQGSGVVPGVTRWVGSVKHPAARSSADCENAALAMLTMATSAGAGLAGKYEAENLQQGVDVWPGDALAVQVASAGVNAELIARTVTVTNVAASQEMVKYAIEFADEWADALSVTTSKMVPAEVWLPQTAAAAPATLASLSGLTVQVTGSQIVVNAGVAAPAGGGFEVRRVDWRFGPGTDGTLVLRAPVENFTILREAAIEQYYVRIYDGATPPNYSRFSAEVAVSVPLSAN